jgi:hypothetical protein
MKNTTQITKDRATRTTLKLLLSNGYAVIAQLMTPVLLLLLQATVIRHDCVKDREVLATSDKWNKSVVIW